LNHIITLFSICITVCAYIFSRKLGERYPSPFTTPVFFSTIVVIFILSISRINYEEYHNAKEIMTYLLGPATVALAVPLYKNKDVVLQQLLPACMGLVVGSICTIVSAVLLAKLFRLADWIVISLSLKSITVPVALEVSEIIGGDPVLVSGFVIITGMLGAMFGPWIMSICQIHHPFARGLSIGTIAHGIGTAEISREGSVQGAVSGVAMGVAAIITSLFLPFFLPFMLWL
jgi:predicted murein hydrolase (TIGR00659 family)